MRSKIALAALVAGAASLLASTARADDILYYNDYVIGTDQMSAALADSAITSLHTVTVATDWTDFATKLAGGTYELAIAFQQGNVSDGTAFSAVETFVAGGGRAIVTDWYVLDDTNIDGLQADFTGGINQSSMTVSDAALAAGLTNPVILFNPGWGTYSMDLGALAGGYLGATFGGGQGAIVVGHGGRSIVNGFLSDTFTSGADGKQLYINEIGLVLGTTPVPEPATLALFGLGAAGLWRRRAKAKAAR